MMEMDEKTNGKMCGEAMTPRALTETMDVGRWSIPIYQRLFVWQEEQIWQLLEDLRDAFLSRSDSHYYIGIYTIVVKELANKRKEWTVVDGQQRLTFLSLFAAWCIRTNTLESEWRKFLYESPNVFRIFYFGRNEEQEDLRRIVANQEISTLSNPNFRTFCTCMERLQKSLESLVSPSHTFANYARFIFEHTGFLVSILPQSYNAMDLNRFFEKMNATGRQLSAVDQIRGRYFPADAALFDACLNFEKAFCAPKDASSDDDTLDILTLLDSKEPLAPNAKENAQIDALQERDFNANSVLIPEVLLLHVLKMTLGEGETVHQDSHRILNTFKEKYPKGDENFKKHFLDNLKAYRQWMDENVIYLDKDDKITEYKMRGNNNSMEVEGGKSETETEEEKNRQRILRKYLQLQSMLYVASDSWQKWVLEYYQQTLKDTSQTWDLLKKYQCLKELAKRERTLPDLVQMCYGAIDRYWFRLLDFLLWELAVDGQWKDDKYSLPQLTSEQLEAVRHYRFRQDRSIEHLHPQHPPVEQETNEWLKDRKDNQDKLRDGFGNLALISASFNSSQGNDSIGVKFARVKDNQIPLKKLESIKMLVMFQLAGGSNGNWTPEAAIKHGESMHRILSDFFAQPSTQPSAIKR
ncbi:MAG: DUF262 domain-containing protein [Victivallales bacterium]|nr:DUF262 domain-containing protein [Victivallales bacterium]